MDRRETRWGDTRTTLSLSDTNGTDLEWILATYICHRFGWPTLSRR